MEWATSGLIRDEATRWMAIQIGQIGTFDYNLMTSGFAREIA